MRNLFLLPRSFAAVLLAAFVLVLLPLALALVLAMVQLQGLAESSREANARALDQGAQARQARDSLIGLERALRQAQVLGGSALRDAYRAQRDRLLQSVQSLTDPLAEGAELTQSVQSAAAEVTTAFEDGRPLAALLEFEELQRAANDAIDVAARSRVAEQESLSRLPERVSSTLFGLAAAAVLIAIVLAFLFAWRLGRPVRELGDAMRRLGEGNLDVPVSVEGVNDMRRLGERLEWLRQRLATLENTRTRFLRSMSHDLKTPIASIAEGAASLDEELYGPLTPPQRSVVGVIRHNTDRLLTRIEALLRADRPTADVASQASVTSGPHLAPVELAGVVRNVLDDHALALSHRRLRLVSVADNPATVVGDAEGLRVLIDNLLSNAIKFSPPGGRIEVRMETDEKQVHLTVIDDGPGVAAGEEERIFDLAVRGSAALLSGAPGSGHGLAIARDIATTHGGKLRVGDGGKRGAQFVLSLPRVVEVEHATVQ